MFVTTETVREGYSFLYRFTFDTFSVDRQSAIMISNSPDDSTMQWGARRDILRHDSTCSFLCVDVHCTNSQFLFVAYKFVVC